MISSFIALLAERFSRPRCSKTLGGFLCVHAVSANTNFTVFRSIYLLETIDTQDTNQTILFIYFLRENLTSRHIIIVIGFMSMVRSHLTSKKLQSVISRSTYQLFERDRARQDALPNLVLRLRGKRPSTLPSKSITYLHFLLRLLRQTYYLACLLHDIGTAERFLSTTKLSFEFKGAIVARDLILSVGGQEREDQADSVCDAIIRHQDIFVNGWVRG